MPKMSRSPSRDIDWSITATSAAGDRPACRGAQLSTAEGDDARPGPTPTRVGSPRWSPQLSTGEIAEHQRAAALIDLIELKIWKSLFHELLRRWRIILET